VLEAARRHLQFAEDCEITLEANPGTVERGRFTGYRAVGVNRVSLGAQSFDAHQLEALGRIHSPGETIRAAEELHAAGLSNFNLDLMYALPGQTLEQFDADLKQALDFKPPHLSIYHLTIEPNTFFAKHPPAIPDDDLAFDMLDRIVERTAASGLARYEVSAFAQPGHRCLHNQNYWQFGDYLGIGAGAHSKLSFPHRVVRQIRYRDPARYMAQALAGAAISQDEEVARKQLPFEFMLNALRLVDGFELVRFAERTGMPLSAIRAPLDKALAQGLVEQDGGWVRPTTRGMDFLSDLQSLFLAE
jgi:oxygen-independent coproporphyrinogen-3 oxidase